VGGAGERERPLGHRVDLAVEAVELGEGARERGAVGEGGAEHRVRRQRALLVGRQAHRLGVAEHVLEAGEDDVAAVLGEPAEEERHAHVVGEPAGVGVGHEGGELVGVDGEGACDHPDESLGTGQKK
jgi:hypothetical protein